MSYRQSKISYKEPPIHRELPIIYYVSNFSLFSHISLFFSERHFVWWCIYVPFWHWFFNEMKSTNLFIHMLRQFFFLSRSTIFFALFRLKCRCLFWVWSVKCEVARYFSLPTWLPNGYSCLFSDFSKERQINTMWTCANEMNLCKMGWFFLLLLLQLVDTTHTAYRIASSFISYK